jgi:hypothetical protein
VLVTQTDAPTHVDSGNCRRLHAFSHTQSSPIAVPRRDARIKRTLKEWETPSVSLTDVGGYLGHRDMGQTNKYLSTTTQRIKAALAEPDDARTHLAQPPSTDQTSNTAVAVTH